MTAKEIKELVGKTIEYVLERDVDHSGRGYFRSRTGKIISQTGRNVLFENYEDWVFWREFREYRVLDTGDMENAKSKN